MVFVFYEIKEITIFFLVKFDVKDTQPRFDILQLDTARLLA